MSSERLAAWRSVSQASLSAQIYEYTTLKGQGTGGHVQCMSQPLGTTSYALPSSTCQNRVAAALTARPSMSLRKRLPCLLLSATSIVQENPLLPE